MTNVERTQALRNALRPLYANLLDSIKKYDYSKAIFCAQWGTSFPIEQNTGIVFVGRATNGWITDSESIDVLFGDDPDAIFNRDDQMEWVENLSGNMDGYNTRKSSFWRIIRNVSSHFYPDNWFSYIAWSNLCKVAPWVGGNPNDALFDAQFQDCEQILQTEIRILSPKVVVLLTGQSWARDFLKYLNRNQDTNSGCEVSWDDYECNVYKIGDITYILTEHPQGKKEDEHTKCLIELITKTIH
jgi:hypothetical protein